MNSRSPHYPSDQEIAAAHQKSLPPPDSDVVAMSHFCPSARLISTAMKADPRVPTLADLSGAWVHNPEFAGPSHEFALTQTGQQITGLGCDSGCTQNVASKIGGTREGRALRLEFTTCNDNRPQTMRFEVVDYHGTIALARDWREESSEYQDAATKLKMWDHEKLHPSLVPMTKQAELGRTTDKSK